MTQGKRWLRPAPGALAFALLAATVPAQGMEVTEGPLQPGQTVTVEYADASSAGQTVMVHIDNGDPGNMKSSEVAIQLDAQGRGSAQWTVPEAGWNSAVFTAPTGFTVVRFVGWPAAQIEQSSVQDQD